MLLPEWIETAVVTDNYNKRIFTEIFVIYTRQRNQNTILLLRNDIYINLVAFAHDLCWHPDDAIVSVRRHHKTNEKPATW